MFPEANQLQDNMMTTTECKDDLKSEELDSTLEVDAPPHIFWFDVLATICSNQEEDIQPPPKDIKIINE